MHVSKVLDIDGSFQQTTALVAGEKIVIQGFNVKDAPSVGAKVAEITTTDGLRHSFGKTIIGQAKSDYWIDTVKKCVDADSTDGLDVYVIEREAEGTGRMMLALSMFPPKN
tara:strand:+ start:355 stop:687 length:333 start_codon:yes stop_codon:yes gene_type:complete